MPERGGNQGYLETDIDEILDQTSVESDSLSNGGSRPSSKQNGNSDTKHISENNDPEVTSKTPFLDTGPNQGGTSRTDNSLVGSSEGDIQINSTEEHVPSNSPFLLAIDESESSETSEFVTYAPFPRWRHVAAVILFFPLGWFAYKKAKEAYEERTKPKDKKGQRRREFAEGLTTVSICLGIAMLFLLFFLLVARLLSFFWQPGNLAKLCHDIQMVGYTSRACPNVDISYMT